VILAQRDSTHFAASFDCRANSPLRQPSGANGVGDFLELPRYYPNGGLQKITKKSGSQRELFTPDERIEYDALKMTIYKDA
jgi:hypothetical protein